jgi:hypothetical protein
VPALTLCKAPPRPQRTRGPKDNTAATSARVAGRWALGIVPISDGQPERCTAPSPTPAVTDSFPAPQRFIMMYQHVMPMAPRIKSAGDRPAPRARPASGFAGDLVDVPAGRLRRFRCVLRHRQVSTAVVASNYGLGYLIESARQFQHCRGFRWTHGAVGRHLVLSWLMRNTGARILRWKMFRRECPS